MLLKMSHAERRELAKVLLAGLEVPDPCETEKFIVSLMTERGIPRAEAEKIAWNVQSANQNQE